MGDISSFLLLVLLTQFSHVAAIVKTEDHPNFRLITNRIQNITCMHEDNFQKGRLFLCTNSTDITIFELNNIGSEKTIKLDELLMSQDNTVTTTTTTTTTMTTNPTRSHWDNYGKTSPVERYPYGYKRPVSDYNSGERTSRRLVPPVIGDLVQLNESALLVSIINRNQLQLLTWTEDGTVRAECLAGKSCIDHDYYGSTYVDGSQFEAKFHSPSGMLLTGNSVYVCQPGNTVALREIDLQTKYVTTVAEGKLQIEDAIPIFPFINPSSGEIYAAFKSKVYHFNLNRETLEEISFHNLNIWYSNRNRGDCGRLRYFWNLGYSFDQWNCYSTASAMFVSDNELVLSSHGTVYVLDISCKSIEVLLQSDESDNSYDEYSYYTTPYYMSYGGFGSLYYQDGVIYAGKTRGFYKLPITVEPTVMCVRDQVIMAIALSSSIAFIILVGLIVFGCVRCKRCLKARKEAREKLLPAEENDEGKLLDQKKQFKRSFSCRRVHCAVDCFVASQ